jgi:hypothetical protein
MGLDAAIRFNSILGKEKVTWFIVEGPLDAGRIGPPALAILGKYMSEYQAAVVAKHFSKAVIVADNDFSGKSMKEICKKVLGLKMEVDTLEVPDGFKDIGEMSQAEATKMIQPYLFG